MAAGKPHVILGCTDGPRMVPDQAGVVPRMLQLELLRECQAETGPGA